MSIMFFSACILGAAYCGLYAAYKVLNRQWTDAVSLGVMTVIAAGAVVFLMLGM